MAERSERGAWGAHMSRLVEAAVGSGVPRDIAEVARDATTRALTPSDPALHEALRRRAEGYFWAVVRRRLVRRRSPSSATARFVLAAVVADLVDSGRDTAEVWDEIERGWRDKVPGEVLEEFRVRMCA